MVVRGEKPAGNPLRMAGVPPRYRGRRLNYRLEKVLKRLHILEGCWWRFSISTK